MHDVALARSGSYEIETLLDDTERGTAIRCYLRDDCAEFSKEETIKRRIIAER
jgi:HSP90 family molecular chaperone